MNFTLRDRWEQIQRRWMIVAVITVLTVLGSIVFALNAHETYTGKSTLILSGRTPDQDAVMVVGYLTLFNDPATVDQLKATNDLPEDVTAEAQTAGASPILNILATADDPTVAQDAAQKMAQAFSADINVTQRKGKDDRLADLQSRLEGVNPLAPDGSSNPYFTALQTQIEQVKSDPTNELMILQTRAGVNENAPSTIFTVLSGALGGLALGILAALGMAALSRRPANATDLRQKTGIETLAEVPAATNSERETIRRERLRALANVVSLEGPPPPRTIAVTETRGGSQAREIALALAQASAQRGSRTVLVYADNVPNPWASDIGFNDVLVEGGPVHKALTAGDVGFLTIMGPGSTLADRYSFMSGERIGEVFDQLRSVADTVVLVAPPIADNVEAPLLCATADVTILVVARKSARFADVTSAAGALKNVRARLLGAVLVERSGGKRLNSENGETSDSPQQPAQIFELFPEQPASAWPADAVR